MKYFETKKKTITNLYEMKSDSQANQSDVNNL